MNFLSIQAALLALLFTPSSTTAFSPSCIAPNTFFARSQIASNNIIRSQPLLFATTDKDEKGETEPIIDKAPTEAGTHEELMYALGVNLARQLGDIRPLVENGDELTQVAKGLLDTVIGRLSDEGQRALLSSRGKELNLLITDRANKIQQRVEAAGKEMLKTMAETEGVEKLPTGVCLHILDHGPEGKGNGVRPTAASTVKVHYHGTLPDGTIFDSTLGGDPVTFAVGQVIPGWKQALLKMHEGETAMIGIPSEQAYGKNGTPDGSIPGGAAIFFKVQLLEVLTAGIGGGPTLLGADGKKLSKNNAGGGGLLGADGKPLV